MENTEFLPTKRTSKPSWKIKSHLDAELNPPKPRKKSKNAAIPKNAEEDFESFIEVKKEKIDRCFGCFFEGINLSSDPEIVLTYQELLKNGANPDLLPSFCSICSTALENIKKFKDSCVSSLEKISLLMYDVPKEPKIEQQIDYEEPLVEYKIIESKENVNESQSLVLKIQKSPKRTGPVSRFADASQFCNTCNLDFPCGSFNSHVVPCHFVHLDERYNRCQICSNKVWKASSYGHFLRHNKQFNEPKECEVCKKKFIEVYAYEKHLKIMHLNLECAHCEYKTGNKNLMKSHIHTQHFGYKRCYTCTKYFLDHEEYKNHLEWELEKRKEIKSFMCDICGFEAKYKNALDVHKDRKHSTETFTCKICNKTGITSKHNLRYHERQYHEKLPLSCEHCGKGFLNKKECQNHIESIHLKVQVECPICRKSFNKPNLRPHLKRAHSNVPFSEHKCKKCGRAFRAKAMLIKHSYSHENKRPYNCHLCKTGYYMTQYLKSHYQRIHSLEYTLEEVRKVCRIEKLNF